MQALKQIEGVHWKWKVYALYENDVPIEPVLKSHSASLPPYVPTLGQE